MAKIHLLDDALVNKIAAGEVVERPASVVKELVENALDAGADHITIELEEGGQKRITIIDNGVGMGPEDALLCLKRHATSKIRKAEDLFKIGTMGFRGEALAAISGVAKVTINTRPRKAPTGTQVVAYEGQVESTPWNGADGTSITVEDLFYNVPARKSFLKKASAEFAQCAELIRQLTLSVPHVTFSFLHNGKKQLLSPKFAQDDENAQVDTPFKGEAALRARAAYIYPEEEVRRLIYVRKVANYGAVEGLISPPGMEKPTGKWIQTFVNDRFVRDKVVRYGIMRGYHSHLLKGRHPFVVLHLYCDPSLVDVNVHPAKAELRFQYSNEVQELIALAIREGLRSGAWAGMGDADSASALAEPESPTETFIPPAPKDAPRDFDLSYTPSPRSYSTYSGKSYASSSKGYPVKPRDMTTTTRVESFGSFSASEPAPAFDQSLWEEKSSSMQISSQNESVRWYELQYLGCFARCYLMFEQDERLLVVDQHAFHERVLYEKLRKRQELLTQKQPLLMPEVLELTPTEVSLLEEHQKNFAGMGFELRAVSATEVEVLSVPALVAQKDFTVILQDLLGKEHVLGTEDAGDWHHDILSTLACHAAVRAGEELSREDLQSLLREAEEVDFFLNCPHGRRVFRWFEKGQVAAWFDR